MTLGLLPTAYGLLASVARNTVILSRAESGMALRVVEEERMAKQTCGKCELEAEHVVRSLGLRATLPGLNIKPAFSAKRVRSS